MSDMVNQIYSLEDMNRRLKERNEYLHKLARDRVIEYKPSMWLVVIVRDGERMSCEFDKVSEAKALYESEIRNNTPAMLYECTPIKTFIPLEELL